MSLPLRLGLFYAAIFIGTGAASPYMPVWFASRGLSGAEIGVILSAPMLARAIVGPAIAIWADSFVLRRTPMMLLGLGAAGATALMAAPFGFWWWFGIWFAASSLMSAVAPLTDVIALARSRSDGFNFGWPRGIGSVAFVVGNIGMGAILVRTAPASVLVWVASAAAVMGVSARLLLPPDPVREEGGKASFADRWAGLNSLVRDRDFMLAVVSAGLIQSAHAFYYAFSTLSWLKQGVAPNLTGLLWAAAVAVEVCFFWFMEPWRRRLGARHLLVIGGAGSVFRWTVLAFSPPLWVLFPLQALHTLSYAATFVATLQIVERLSTARSASAAQQINSALSGGVLAGLAGPPAWRRFKARLVARAIREAPARPFLGDIVG